MKNLAAFLGVPHRRFNVYACMFCAFFHVGTARPDIDQEKKLEKLRYAALGMEKTTT